MRRTWLLLPVLCFLAPLGAGSAAAATQPTLKECKSAKPWAGDPAVYYATCKILLATERNQNRPPGSPPPVEGPTVYDTHTTTFDLPTSNIPTWSDADILAQFASSRDTRYISEPSHAVTPRRISWLYPEDGCFTRAEQFDVRAANAGKTRPYKLFALGPLRVFTSNTPTGLVKWGWHVVPVVKNSVGELIVLDAALSPCKPLPWKRWLALMADDVSVFDDPDSGFSVSIGDSWAYTPGSLAASEPPHSAESLAEQQSTWLPLEWDRQVELGRNPDTVLANSPPWSGFACVSTQTEITHSMIPANSTVNVDAICPIGTVVVGGGMGISPDTVLISKNVKNGNGWQTVAKNVGPDLGSLSSQAVCLTGSPNNKAVTTVTGTSVNVTNNSFATATASCASGTLVGGGFTTTQGNSTVMRIYANRRSTTNANTWEVSAYNLTGNTKTVAAVAYCLSGTQFTFSQTSGNLTATAQATATCSAPKSTMGGGFVFPRTTNYTVMGMHNNGSTYAVEMRPAPASGDSNAKGYAECLTHP